MFAPEIFVVPRPAVDRKQSTETTRPAHAPFPLEVLGVRPGQLPDGWEGGKSESRLPGPGFRAPFPPCSLSPLRLPPAVEIVVEGGVELEITLEVVHADVEGNGIEGGENELEGVTGEDKSASCRASG